MWAIPTGKPGELFAAALWGVVTLRCSAALLRDALVPHGGSTIPVAASRNGHATSETSHLQWSYPALFSATWNIVPQRVFIQLCEVVR